MIENAPVSRAAPTDAELLAASLEHPESFRTLFERHYQPVWRFLAWRFGAAAAEDACAETFATAFAERGRYDSSHADARPWLLGIAVNHGRRHARRERRRLEQLEDTVSRSHSGPTVGLDPRGELARGLLALDRRDREPLLLLALADLSYTQIAVALGIPEGTVRSRINRARRQLKEAIQE
jgi:RNA polymerase sigma-70 factor (ECF subfamily)